VLPSVTSGSVCFSLGRLADLPVPAALWPAGIPTGDTGFSSGVCSGFCTFRLIVLSPAGPLTPPLSHCLRVSGSQELHQALSPCVCDSCVCMLCVYVYVCMFVGLCVFVYLCMFVYVCVSICVSASHAFCSRARILGIPNLCM
jgi:hypothetical protein